MNEVIEEWTIKAEQNYISAVELAKRKRKQVLDVICNQCQQSAEKYLKALLARHHVAFSKTHDMKQLYDLIMTVEPDIRLFEEQILSLDPYGVDIRYPGLQASDIEVEDAIKAMKQVRKFARARLGLKTR